MRKAWLPAYNWTFIAGIIVSAAWLVKGAHRHFQFFRETRTIRADQITCDASRRLDIGMTVQNRA
jgi:hypothetical protein